MAGSPKLRYRHHINIKGLERLEEILTTLWSPQWPEDTLPAIDRDQAARGKVNYDELCVHCHAVIDDRTDPERAIKAVLMPVDKVGTDATMATNIATSTSKTGILEGQPMLPLTQVLPNLGIIEQFGPEAPTVKVVGNGVIGILREEFGLVRLARSLPAYIKAVKAKHVVRRPRSEKRRRQGLPAAALQGQAPKWNLGLGSVSA